MARAKSLRVATALLVSAALAACGTTVDSAGTDASGKPRAIDNTDGLTAGESGVSAGEQGFSGGAGGASGAGAGGEAAAVSGGAGGSQAGSGDDPSGGSGFGGASGSGAAPGVTSAGGPLPPGVTKDKVFVGIPYNPGADGVRKSLGVEGVTSGDVKRTYETVIGQVNADGGVLGGRKISPIFYEFNSSQSGDAAAQEECAHYTQDNKVFATLGSGGSENSRQCLLKGGVSAVVLTTLTRSNSAVFARYPNYVEPATLSYDRTMRPYVHALTAQAYFRGPVVPGVITMDDEQLRPAVDRILLPSMKAAGHPVQTKNVVYVKFPASSADFAQVANEISSAVLRFRTNGVTHLVINDFAGTIAPGFMPQAEKQGYRPRYGLTTHTGAQVFLDSGLIPPEQLKGAVGIGWYPMLDLPARANPDNGPFSNSTRQKCLAFLRSKGIAPPDANAKGAALAICDNVWLLVAALNKSGQRDPDTGTFVRGLNALGSSYTVGLAGGGSFFDAQHHQGVGSVRYWSFRDDCSCMTYGKNLVRVP